MMTGQKKYRENEFTDKESPDRAYSSDEKVNSLLNRFCEQADNSRIWFSVDAYGIEPGHYGNGFFRVFELMLNAAYDECLETFPPRARYMKLRSREAQKRMFIQLTYSTGTQKPNREQDQRILEIGEEVRKKNGYFCVKSDNDETSIRLSVPDRAYSHLLEAEA